MNTRTVEKMHPQTEYLETWYSKSNYKSDPVRADIYNKEAKIKCMRPTESMNA